MRVKLQHNLQPSEHSAHGVVIEDDNGVPICVAMQFDDHIICSTAGEPDFHAMLETLGVKKKIQVDTLTPKPIDKIVWTP